MLWVLRRFGPDSDIRLASLGLGVIGGLLLPWSNDHGLSMALALLPVGSAWLWWRGRNHRVLGDEGEVKGGGGGRWSRRLQALALLPLTMGFSTAVVVLVITAGGLQEWFAYNFLNVAQDQFWYFVGPTTKVTTIYDIPVYRGVLVAVACLGLLGWKICRAGCRPEDAVLAFLVLSNLLAGYVSTSGALNERYFFPLYRCLVVVVPYLAWSAMCWAIRASLAPAIWEALARRSRQVTAAAVGAIVVCSLLAMKASYQEQEQQEAVAATALKVPELGGTLGQHFNKAIAVAREIREQALAVGVPDKQRLFSTYASAMDVVAAAPHAARSDYIIHALGPGRRRDYVQQFTEARPLFVTTLREDFTAWESWVRSMNWDFYAQLLKNYQPVDRTSYNIVWERRNETAVWPEIPLETAIRQRADSEVELEIHFPKAAVPEPGQRYFVEVEIDYDWTWKAGRLWRGALRPYLFARDNSRPEWGLAPYETTRRFPVELAPGETCCVSFVCLPLDSTKLSIPRSTARALLPKSHIDGFALTRLRASSHCDQNWTNGIWIREAHAAFFVSDAGDVRSLQPGSRLRFRAAGERIVERILNDQVWLQGPPLSPAEDGYPHAIQVVAP
jgi:hypothetical protein